MKYTEIDQQLVNDLVNIYRGARKLSSNPITYSDSSDSVYDNKIKMFILNLNKNGYKIVKSENQ